MFQNNYTVIFFTVTPYFYRYDIRNVFSDASRFGCIVLDYKLDFTRIFGIGICIGKLTAVRDLTRLDYVSSERAINFLRSLSMQDIIPMQNIDTCICCNNRTSFDLN